MKTQEFKIKLAEISNEELVQYAEKQVIELAKTYGKSFKMSIPPMITDSDIIIIEMINRFKQHLVCEYCQENNKLTCCDKCVDKMNYRD